MKTRGKKYQEAATKVDRTKTYSKEEAIDLVKETISRFKEAEIDQSVISDSAKEEMKSQWKQWLDATTHGIKDELRAVAQSNQSPKLS